MSRRLKHSRVRKTSQPGLQDAWEALEAMERVLEVGLPGSFYFHIRMTEWPTLPTAPLSLPPTRPGEEGSSSPQ